MEKKLIILIVCLFLSGFNLQGQSITGDVDNSGQVDIIDALLVAQYYVGMNPSGFYPDRADVDDSSSIDIIDALFIAQYCVGLISVFPVDLAEGIEVKSSDLPRNTNPDATEDELLTVAESINQFALDNYQLLNDEEGNIFFSPLSIYYAMAMCYAGARGNTKTEMADTMYINLVDDRYHNAMNALENTISNDPTAVPADEGTPAPTVEGTPPPTPAPTLRPTGEVTQAPLDNFTLNLVNSSWGQKGYHFEPDYLDILAVNYGAGMNLVDFFNNPEGSRLLINDWVYEQTNECISDLLPPDSIGPETLLVLTNVIYFKANWHDPFNPSKTVNGEFNQQNGRTVTVRMMNNDFYTGYMEVPGQYQAIMLMYHYNPDETIRNYMVIILPENLQTFENSFTYDVYNSILDNMTEERVVLAMPKFDFEYKKNMNNTLISLGMVDAFNPGASDFSGINGGTKLLFIEKIYHKSFISVDENGTEAAAATFGTLMPGVDPPPTMTIDRPFIFVIGNANTGAILFIGRAAEL